MEVAKQESKRSANSEKSKLQYPPRSATKKTKDKETVSSTSKRVKPASCVSAVDISEADKAVKPAGRLSVHAKTSTTPFPRSTRTRTPISETRTKGVKNGEGNNEEPVSGVSKTMSRRKFSILSSVSYWLSQIKLSESAAKHSISLGFFKLAAESGCEPLQRMRDELKSYAQRHNLVELGEPLKEVLTSYNISADIDQLQVSETFSEVPEATQSSEDIIRRRSSSNGAGRKLKPKPASSENVQASTVAEPAKTGSLQRVSARKSSSSVSRNSTKSNTVIDMTNSRKKSPRIVGHASKTEKAKTQKQSGNIVVEKGHVESLSAEESAQDDKENKETQQLEE